MHLNEIVFTNVPTALENPDQRTFNTSFHTAASPADLSPDQAPCSFLRWLPVIAPRRSSGD
jgi:hypothetical protein